MPPRPMEPETARRRRLVIHATHQRYAVEMAILCGVLVRLVVNACNIDGNEYMMAIIVTACAVYYFLLNTIQKMVLRQIYGYLQEDIVQITL